MDRQPSSAARPILTAEVLSIGTELTTGETADTNGGELARSLTASGVRVARLTALPDRRDDVEGAFRAALERSDLIVSTGGLGPTPDDLTRESIAAVVAETPSVDLDLERWLRGLWERRGMPFAEINLKQAWLIPSARALPNPNGTAPGWWVDRPDGRVVVLLPGPPREMRPMWRDEALPSLRDRGLGSEQAVRTLRLAGIGESAVAERLGEAILRATNPVVATYARAEAVDVRLSAVGRPARDGVPARSADELLDEVEPVVLGAVGAYVWARGATTWSEAVGAALAARGWSLATSEIATGGSLVSLFGARDWLIRSETMRATPRPGGPAELARTATRIRTEAGAEVGLAVAVRQRGADTAVSLAVATPDRVARRRSMAFLGGDQGRLRSALMAAAFLVEVLRAEP